MARLIIKTKYYSKDAVKHKSNYVKYLATRDGVVINPENMRQDAKSRCIDDKSNYIEYIAKRPGAQKEIGREHGLFSYAGYDINLECIMDLVANHNAPVWNNIISLTREDAEKYGYDQIESWQSLLRSHVDDIAKSFKIDPDNLEWYAAFHDETYHPHIHMVVFARDGQQGHLTKKGLEMFKSRIANDIFRSEMLPIFQRKTCERKSVKEAARDELRNALREANNTKIESVSIAQQMINLSGHLKKISGKKQYGYLNKNVKKEVDAIVEALANYPTIDNAYKKWLTCQEKLQGFYKDGPGIHIPLSKNNEFKSIKNMIIKEAEFIGNTDTYIANMGVCVDSFKMASAAVTRLGKAIEDLVYGLESQMPNSSNKPVIESKTRQAEMKKRMALGERVDDEEPQANQGMSM